jgi:hypothetical protein
MIPAEEGLHDRSTDWSVCLVSALSQFSGSVERLPWLAADVALTHLNEYIRVSLRRQTRQVTFTVDPFVSPSTHKSSLLCPQCELVSTLASHSVHQRRQLPKFPSSLGRRSA